MNDQPIEPPFDRDDPVVDLLGDIKPTPAPDFRRLLGRRLVDEDPGWGPRPDYLWPQALALVLVGVVLLLIGALVSAGGI
jgi:hypothetical protein